MPVVDVLPVTAPQTRQTLHQVLRVPHLQLLRVQPHLDALTDQPARHRVVVPLDVDQAAAVHLDPLPTARWQTPRRQGTQHGQLLGQPRTPARIELLQQLPQKLGIGRAVREIPAATQHQGLVQRLLETPVPLLDVAILVGLPRLDLLANESVMGQQRLITLRELLGVRGVLHGQAHAIGAVPQRYAAQFRQGVLQAFTEALKALREADRGRFPVRISQHKVVDQVVEVLSLERHAQAAQVREVRGAQAARLVDLSEENFLGRPGRGSPAAHVTLQGPQLTVGEAPRIAALQFLQQGLGLQAGLPVEQAADLGPHLDERIDTGRPGMRHGNFAGQHAGLQVFAGRLGVHVGQQGTTRQAAAGIIEPKQFANLLVRDHRKPPCAKTLR
jgi:hypothetical protein